ncbi:MAG TPA: PmeII family type II restriction endonuclease [Pyrinomonadaceae bacterium]|nr:PmeII family type II restriction endonuclease [Pyrinomonadaceae bacterium]
MTQISDRKLESLIKKCLEGFYTRRIAKLSGLKLRDTLRKKNPYLFRAIGIQRASEIVERLLRDYMSSSDEGIFGDAFFEPLAKAVSGGVVAPSEGVDIAIESPTRYTAIAVKSGPNIFNSSQAKRMNDEFASLRSRLMKLHKQFDPVLAHCYGRKQAEPSKSRGYRIRSGQRFWNELTGDPDFFLKLISLMKDHPEEHRIRYDSEWNKAVNRFERDFLIDFSTSNGEIDWEKLVRFNSGEYKGTFS